MRVCARWCSSSTACSWPSSARSAWSSFTTDARRTAVAEHRRDRVAHLIRAELARLLLQEARDPRLQTVTLTEVRVSPDLRLAHVHFRTLPPEATPRAAEQALRRATPF